MEKALIGRPWQTVEAFTVIIRAQVDALISLGADPKLEVSNVASLFYINYLLIFIVTCDYCCILLTVYTSGIIEIILILFIIPMDSI